MPWKPRRQTRGIKTSIVQNGGEYEDDSFMGYSAVFALMIVAVCTFETSVYFNDTARRCMLEGVMRCMLCSQDKLRSLNIFQRCVWHRVQGIN
jgi:hypothetical protein